ncbi:hypothetical protein GCM10020219_052710 [Nonomuraea dietziae]
MLSAGALLQLAQAYGTSPSPPWPEARCCWPRARSPPRPASLAKWALLGRIARGDRPLWSSFVWRNELADNFVEVLAAPWFAEPWLGSAPLNVWLRSLGASIGHGVSCHTYWLPEAIW